MALIKCPKCGNEMSEFAESCPHCGEVVSKEENQEGNKQNNSEQLLADNEKPTESTLKPRNNKKCFFKKWWLWLIIVILVGAVVLFVATRKTENAKSFILEVKTVSQDVTAGSNSKIEKAEKSYSKLTDKEKKQVKRYYKTLVESRNTCDELIADKVEEEIEKLSDSSKIDSICSARARYNKLTTNQQKYVKNYSVLTELEKKKIEPLIDDTIKLIDSIKYTGGEYTDKQYDTILKARGSYDKVPKIYQSKVTNYSVLEKAETEVCVYDVKKQEEAHKAVEEANRKLREAVDQLKAFNYYFGY